MRKIPKTSAAITLTIILLLMANLCFCQIKYGLQESLTISTVNIQNNEYVNASPVLGYNLSGYIVFKNQSGLGLSVEPGFTMKGCNRSYGVNNNFRTKLGYLNVPVLINGYITDNFIVSTGLEMGYMLVSRYKTVDGTTKVKSIYNKPEVSVLVGLTYKMASSFDIGLRTGRGLTTSRVEQITDSNANAHISKSYNRCLMQLIIRYKLN